MKKDLKELATKAAFSFFSGKTEKMLVGIAITYVLVVIIIQAIRFCLQNA